MARDVEKETIGAWIVHHSRKIITDTSAPAEYSALDEAGKAAELLMRLGGTNETNLKDEEVEAIAKSANLNPRTELHHYLELFKKHRLIDSSSGEIQVLGITTSGVLSHAADIFSDAKPAMHERAAIALGEMASNEPISMKYAKDFIGDTFKMKSDDVADFLRRSTEIGFVDQEGDDPSVALLFNGNLFRKDTVSKTAKVLSSLSDKERVAYEEFRGELNKIGCLQDNCCERILSQSLFEKLKAAGVIEVNTVSNENGDHAFVTLPGAFHKFVNPLIDDTFDMAKALVSALTYGMHLRPSSEGRIQSFDWILNALINGREVGPATAIGADYRVLEQNRVIKLTEKKPGMFSMKLLKREVGQLALHVLSKGNANVESVTVLPGAPMSGYRGPEYERERTRRRQSQPSKRHTHDILSALRSRRSI